MGSDGKGSSAEFACQMDLSAGRQVDMEVGSNNELWISAGVGIEVADIWMKDVDNTLDIRVRVKRFDRGLEITLDRGAQEATWWPPDNSPRLTLTYNPEANTASVKAAVGNGHEFQEVLLGKIKLAD